ncbi:hypothetical protein Tco_0985740 [Tanacetum coccineum]
MADLQFVDQYNTVAYLERSDENAEFHQIVDFLTTSSIHYALTISPTIYASYIEQFWATAKSKTFNDVKQIHATVDGKTVVISESSVRNDLHFNNEDVTTVATQHQKTHKPKQAKRGRDTEIPQSSGPPKKVGDEAVYEEVDDKVERATTTAASLDAARSSGGNLRCQEATGGSIAQTRSERVPTHPHDSPLPRVNTLGSDEGSMQLQELIALCIKLSDRVLALETDLRQTKKVYGAAYTKLIMKVKKLEKTVKSNQAKRRAKIVVSDDKEDLENSSKQGRMIKEIDQDAGVTLVTPTHSQEDQPEDQLGVFSAAKVLADAAKNVHTYTKRSRAVSTDSGGVSTASRLFSTAEESISTTGASMLVSTAGIVQEVNKDKGKGKMVEPEPTPKNLRKAQIQMDEELAQRLFEEEHAQFEKEQRIAREKAAEQEAKDAVLIEQMEDVQARIDADKLLAERLQQEEREQFTVDEQARMLVDLIAERKKFFAAQRAKQIRNKPPTKAQLRNKMVTYLKYMGNYTHTQLKSKSFEEMQKLYKKEHKWINDFVPLDSEMVKDSGKEDGHSQKQAESSKKRSRAEHDEESFKKQKLEDEAEREELRACLDIVPGDDIAMDFESLATKYPIINWKTHIMTENVMYYQIIRSDGSSKNYKIFSGMLDDFDRQDVIDLYRLVKERYETTSPEGYDLLLWGDLKNLLEPSEEDEIWKNQQDYNLISWRLFDSCGVHVLLMDTRIAIHMMVENTYPLTQEMLSRMLNRRLEVDHESEMAFELLRFTRSQLQK